MHPGLAIFMVPSQKGPDKPALCASLSMLCGLLFMASQGTAVRTVLGGEYYEVETKKFV